MGPWIGMFIDAESEPYYFNNNAFHALLYDPEIVVKSTIILRPRIGILLGWGLNKLLYQYALDSIYLFFPYGTHFGGRYAVKAEAGESTAPES